MVANIINMSLWFSKDYVSKGNLKTFCTLDLFLFTNSVVQSKNGKISTISILGSGRDIGRKINFLSQCTCYTMLLHTYLSMCQSYMAYLNTNLMETLRGNITF